MGWEDYCDPLAVEHRAIIVGHPGYELARLPCRRAVTNTLEHTRTFLPSRVAAAPGRVAAALETVAVLASPIVLYRFLRLRGIGPPQMPDPSIHTTFILDPHDVFARYQGLLAPYFPGLREAGRVGFLVPARVAYLLFGAVPGFFVFRYLLALVAIVPVYLLLKKLYGRWAGFVGIAVVMSSPVVVTAWGTDYPDSAAVSYLTGGLAALALSCEPGRRRTGWLVVAAGLLTMSVWSHGVSVPLVVVLVVVYLGVRLGRERDHLARDVALFVVSAIVVTGLLAICSEILLGQFDFITRTVQSARYLSSASQIRKNHSASWRWAVYDPYLLVPPAIVLAYIVVFARRWRNIGTTQFFVGLSGGLQLAVFAFLQFFGGAQALEMHYFSSTLWSSVNIMVAMTVAELTRPILGLGETERSQSSAAERWAAGTVQLRWWIASALPALLVLAVALAYEIHPYVMKTAWGGGAGVAAAIVVAAALVGRVTIRWTESAGRPRSRARLGLGGLLAATAVLVLIGATLILTVARPRQHGPLANTHYDPIPAYSTALNGSETPYIDDYAVDSQLPGFVGHPAYRGEHLLTWEPKSEFGDLQGPLGIFDNALGWVSATFPVLDAAGARKIEASRATQVLIMGLIGQHFAQAVRSLARFQPLVVRRGVLTHGSHHLHVWLVDLMHYLRRTRA